MAKDQGPVGTGGQETEQAVPAARLAGENPFGIPADVEDYLPRMRRNGAQNEAKPYPEAPGWMRKTQSGNAFRRAVADHAAGRMSDQDLEALRDFALKEAAQLGVKEAETPNEKKFWSRILEPDLNAEILKSPHPRGICSGLCNAINRALAQAVRQCLGARLDSGPE